MTISACDGSHIPDWLAEYHDWMKWASRVNPWPNQQPRTPSPPQRAAEVKEPLSGATAQAAIQLRYQPTERQSNDNLD